MARKGKSTEEIWGGSLFYMLFVTQCYPRYVPVAATFIGCIGAVWLWEELKDWRGTST